MCMGRAGITTECDGEFGGWFALNSRAGCGFWSARCSAGRSVGRSVNYCARCASRYPDCYFVSYSASVK